MASKGKNEIITSNRVPSLIRNTNFNPRNPIENQYHYGSSFKPNGYGYVKEKKVTKKGTKTFQY